MLKKQFSLAAALLCIALVACFFAWWTYEREPAVGEFLYWDTADNCIYAYDVDSASCGVHSEDPTSFFLTLACRASHVDDSVNGGYHPYLEVSLLFEKNPTPLLVAGAKFPVVLSSDKYHKLQSIVYNSVWEDFSEATVVINESNPNYIDATLKGIDGAGAGSKIAVRAKFKKTGIGRSFSLFDNSPRVRIAMRRLGNQWAPLP